MQEGLPRGSEAFRATEMGVASLASLASVSRKVPPGGRSESGADRPKPLITNTSQKAPERAVLETREPLPFFFSNVGVCPPRS